MKQLGMQNEQKRIIDIRFFFLLFIMVGITFSIGCNNNYVSKVLDGGVIPFEVVSVYADSESSVLIQFDRKLDSASIDSISNFKIEERSTGEQLECLQASLYDYRTIRLETTEHTPRIPYQLEIMNIADQFGKAIPKEGYRLSFLGGDYTGPGISNCQAISPTEIAITFNEPIDLTSVYEPSNYSISPSLTIEQVSVISTTRVILHTVPQSQITQYLLSLTGVADTLGNVYGSTMNEASFAGYVPDVDSTPPVLLSPMDGMQTGLSHLIVWETTQGAAQYTLELATDSTFTTDVETFVLEKDYDTGVIPTYFAYTTTKAVTHYIRLTADITTETVPIHWFEPLDAVYVWGDSTETEEMGTKNKPYKTIGKAIEIGNRLGLDVKIAKVDDAYNESITLFPGVNVLGGFSNTDAWSIRNWTLNETKIRASGSVGITINNINQSTKVEGLTIYASDFGTTKGISINNSSEQVHLENNIIQGGACSGRCYAVEIIGGASVVIDNCTLTGGDPTSTGYSYGVYISYSNPVITNSEIKGGDTGSGLSCGVYNTHASPTLQKNVISGGIAALGGNSYGIYNEVESSPIVTQNMISGGISGSNNTYGIFNIIACSPTLTNNTIIGGNAGDDSYGICMLTSCSPTVVSNVIASGVTGVGTGYALYIAGGISTQSNPILVNNIIFTQGTGAFSYGVYEQNNSTADPAELRNNLFFNLNASDPSTRFYFDNDTTPIDDNPATEDIDALLAGVATIVSGNKTYPSSSPVSDLTLLFTDPFGVSTLDDPWDDYALLPGNRAIDMGVNVYGNTTYGTITEDILGIERDTCGSASCDSPTPAWDCGPYKFD